MQYQQFARPDEDLGKRDFIFQDSLEEFNPALTTAAEISANYTRKCIAVKCILAYADSDPTVKAELSARDTVGVAEIFLNKIADEGFEAFKQRVVAYDIVRRRTGRADPPRQPQRSGGYSQGGSPSLGSGYEQRPAPGASRYGAGSTYGGAPVAAPTTPAPAYGSGGVYGSGGAYGGAVQTQRSELGQRYKPYW